MRRNLSVTAALVATAAAHDAAAQPSEPAAPPSSDGSPSPLISAPPTASEPRPAEHPPVVTSLPGNTLTTTTTHVAGAPPDSAASASANGNVVPHSDWHAVQYVGGFGTPNGSGGGTLGVSFRYRNGLFVGGGLLEVAGKFLTENCLGAAVAMGVAARPWSSLRLELLGTFGMHYYEGVGRAWLFGNDPGTNGTTGYGGARGAVGYVFGRKVYHFELGAYADYQNDFSRERHVYEYPATGTGWFEGGGTGDHVVGASRLGFGLELGATHDML